MNFHIIMRGALLMFVVILCSECHEKAIDKRTINFPKQHEAMTSLPEKKNLWVFILAGQSNMAGRGLVEPGDTMPDKRILSVNKEGAIIMAKEPLHWYEPERTGLDCGYSFARTMIKNLPDTISILLIPTAVGGSSITQWINDSLYRGVKLLTNFASKTQMAARLGTIKAILWHQGESDANDKDIPHYTERLRLLFSRFRQITSNDSLPILLGELGAFSKDQQHFAAINQAIHDYSAGDKFSAVIPTGDLKDRGDSLHFNSEGQRLMGTRFAETYLAKFRF